MPPVASFKFFQVSFLVPWYSSTVFVQHIHDEMTIPIRRVHKHLTVAANWIIGCLNWPLAWEKAWSTFFRGRKSPKETLTDWNQGLRVPGMLRNEQCDQNGLSFKNLAETCEHIFRQIFYFCHRDIFFQSWFPVERNFHSEKIHLVTLEVIFNLWSDEI